MSAVIYTAAPLSAADLSVLEDIEELRVQLRLFLREPRRWYGTLRRTTMARAFQGSNSIEGYHASVEDVAAIVDGEDPLAATEDTRRAIEGYRDAMTYVIQLGSSPPMPPLDLSLVKSLHFMMLKHDLTKSPGQWRPGAVWVEDQDGEVVYEAPPRDDLDPLMSEVVTSVNDSTDHPLVRAAMAHLNMALIHPFSDGNGRMARCMQSYVIASEGLLSPEFLSIEEFLGRNTSAYYQALTDVAQGSWSPHRDTRPWIRFCLTAHYQQAQTLLRRIEEAEVLWDRCEQLAHRHRLPNRSVGALCDAARGWRIRRSLYIKAVKASAGEDITEATATRDLSAMVKVGLLRAVGEKRGRSYQPTDELAQIWRAIREERRRRPR